MMKQTSIIKSSWAVIALATCLAVPFVASAKKTNLTIVHPWGSGSPEHRGFVKAGSEYSKLHPDITVKVLPGTTNEKILTMLAGGAAPDVAIVDGGGVYSWGLREVLIPLDKYIRASGVSKDDFWSASWRECEWDGKVYALPWFTDPNFTMWYNQSVFKEVGLPDRGPETVDELELMSQRTTQKEANGKLKRTGLAPWDVYGAPNTVYTWGWVFGGSFYNQQTKKLTFNDPKVVKAMNWMLDFTKTMGGKAALNPLYYGFNQGKETMRPYGPWELDAWGRKLKFELGMWSMPKAAGVNGSVEWVGGQKIAIPRGVRNPNLSWEFVKWLTATKEGTDAYTSEADTRFMSYKKASSYARFRKDSKLSKYVEILDNITLIRPPVPNTENLNNELNPVIGLMLDKNQDPNTVLKSVNDKMQRQLDQILAKYSKKK